jgi:hypothetical protein
MKQELTALKNILDQTLDTLPENLPQNRTARCRELLASAIVLTDDLLKQVKLPAAATLGRMGGTATAQKGSAYFRKLAARRKTHGGGRPRKDSK